MMVLSWLSANKEWLFSGIGVFAVTLLMSFVTYIVKTKTSGTNTNGGTHRPKRSFIGKAIAISLIATGLIIAGWATRPLVVRWVEKTSLDFLKLNNVEDVGKLMITDDPSQGLFEKAEEPGEADAIMYMSLKPFLMHIGGHHFIIYCPPSPPGAANVIDLHELSDSNDLNQAQESVTVTRLFENADVYFWMVKRKANVLISDEERKFADRVAKIVESVSMAFNAEPFHANLSSSSPLAPFVPLGRKDTIIFLSTKDVFLSLPGINFAIYCPSDIGGFREITLESIDLKHTSDPVSFFAIHKNTDIYAFVRRYEPQNERHAYEIDIGHLEQMREAPTYWTPAGQARVKVKPKVK